MITLKDIQELELHTFRNIGNISDGSIIVEDPNGSYLAPSLDAAKAQLQGELSAEGPPIWVRIEDESEKPVWSPMTPEA